MAASDDSSHYFTEFTLSEIVDMENLYKELGDQSLQKDFCQTVASTFSCSLNRNGKSSVTWKQVQSWFQEKLKQQTLPKYDTLPSSPLEILDLSNLNFAENAVNVEKATYVQRRKGKASDVSDLAFEARSSRDFAWYDVSSFLTYRYLRTGELTR
ncbi:protein SAWADEE HOMEODOMAIN HOMOLOG 1 isoform X2 [Capsella rubella]|uniref:protein SAWADEE HOMEODOMAIN HOMOLOG 1 isoform X2 n=1 Tax=Capsella rubella TaxID=81985 RepID=UPI000CD56571|nr:protein SAWADEE HOMEODOMAIN HOMOLOG 1 isoform X2 [Capsella rubella]